MNKIGVLFLLIILLSLLSVGQESREKIDSAAIAQIKDEGMNRSQVMEILSYLSDVYGPRVTGSPGFKQAAEWARLKLASWDLQNVHLEGWGPFGRGWSLKRYSANVIGRQVFPLISYPKVWSPGTGGTVTGDIVHFDAKTDSAIETYRGKLKGKFVLLNDPRDIKAHFEPEASREADSTLLQLANADFPQGRQRRFEMSADQKARALVDFHKMELCQKEGATGILTISRGDGGNIFVQQASVPQHPDTPAVRRVNVYDPKAPKILPQVAVGAEHYNRLVRMLQKGEHPRLELNLDVNFFKEDSSYNIIAELPGTDLKDEVVMIGAHFDSWQGGTGATDNGTGSSVCMEAMRILKTLNLKPRRTIRMGLWGGEEQGLLGSKAYVTKHFGEKEGGFFERGGKVTLKPEAEKFSAYFNNDNGSGKVRGVYMQGNEAVRPIFRAWLRPFADMGASTLTLENTGGTDHQSFDALGLPGFQFIQDELEYGSRTHHSTMDVYDRVQPEDLKQASVIMAVFAYNAAMRDEKFPHKPMPAPQAAQGSH
ncbi:MAG: M20/M25/M40 family metallo-hydrolase [Ignavibacteria bacterium]|nr:M20/M25/M40 family metallo-hydrolase [Ignavibacteria bacterium]MBI3766090.1 M20/M25/M40 family metallo-hydrolase [Ignavibacteriales bacterium]